MVVEEKKLVRTEHAVLDIGEQIGALVIYTQADMLGRQIDVTGKDRHTARTHTDVLERRFNGKTFHAALFAALPEGVYSIWINLTTPIGEVRITGGQVAEIDWRHLYLNTFVPPQPVSPLSSKAICPTPMRAAPLRYTDDGKVAWDQMWTDFCDLALLGGPPHRGTLLEPVMSDEVAKDPEAYEQVVQEIERGWKLITPLSTTRCTTPGWVGLICVNEEMALWLLRAILVENVSVRREGRTLFLPAGPHFTIGGEIKNVVTVIAKTYHYWQEHRNNMI